jgi:hypothetical protein
VRAFIEVDGDKSGMEGLHLSSGRTRFAFGVMNLALQRDIRCGRFVLTPIPSRQEELSRRTSLDSEPVVSAIGTLTLPVSVDADAAWEYVDGQPVNEIMLLLSFAQRRYVDIVNPELQVLRDGTWQFWATRFHIPLPGNPQGVSWLFGHDELQAFVDRCLPLVAEADRGGSQGLRVALQLYRTNFRDDYVEMHYLKTWMALEVLYARHEAGGLIVDPARFKGVERGIKMALKALQSQGMLIDEERRLMQEKVAELNRLAARRQALRFFANVFAQYPAQRVTDDDLKTFIEIRNHITHAGVMASPIEGGYGTTLNHQHGRLRSLLERVLLALLGQEANLMAFSWTEWLAGA